MINRILRHTEVIKRGWIRNEAGMQVEYDTGFRF